MNESQIKVVLVDDHPVFRIGMAAMLDSLPGVSVVGQATTPTEAIDVTLDAAPDVVLMDLDLDGESGIETTRDLLRVRPEVGVLVITMFGDDDSLFAALRAGARGYVLKGAAPAEIERAVRAVAHGEILIGRQVARRAAAYLSGARTSGTVVFPELTDREREVLDQVARGYDNHTIARRLVLSNKTVRNYVSGILAKLAVRDRPTLIVVARDAGLGASDGPGGDVPSSRDA